MLHRFTPLLLGLVLPSLVQAAEEPEKLYWKVLDRVYDNVQLRSGYDNNFIIDFWEQVYPNELTDTVIQLVVDALVTVDGSPERAILDIRLDENLDVLSVRTPIMTGDEVKLPDGSIDVIKDIVPSSIGASEFGDRVTAIVRGETNSPPYAVLATGFDRDLQGFCNVEEGYGVGYAGAGDELAFCMESSGPWFDIFERLKIFELDGDGNINANDEVLLDSDSILTDAEENEFEVGRIGKTQLLTSTLLISQIRSGDGPFFAIVDLEDAFATSTQQTVVGNQLITRAAVEWEISIGGYYEAFLAYSSTDTSTGASYIADSINPHEPGYYYDETTNQIVAIYPAEQNGGPDQNHPYNPIAVTVIPLNNPVEPATTLLQGPDDSHLRYSHIYKIKNAVSSEKAIVTGVTDASAEPLTYFANLFSNDPENLQSERGKPIFGDGFLIPLEDGESTEVGLVRYTAVDGVSTFVVADDKNTGARELFVNRGKSSSEPSVNEISYLLPTGSRPAEMFAGPKVCSNQDNLSVVTPESIPVSGYPTWKRLIINLEWDETANFLVSLLYDPAQGRFVLEHVERTEPQKTGNRLQKTMGGIYEWLTFASCVLLGTEEYRVSLSLVPDVNGSDLVFIIDGAYRTGDFTRTDWRVRTNTGEVVNLALGIDNKAFLNETQGEFYYTPGLKNGFRVDFPSKDNPQASLEGGFNEFGFPLGAFYNLTGHLPLPVGTGTFTTTPDAITTDAVLGDRYRVTWGVNDERGQLYSNSPWSITFIWDGEPKGKMSVAPGGELDDVFSIGIRYELPKGVRINAFDAYGGDDIQVDGDQIDGFVIGTGIGLSF